MALPRRTSSGSTSGSGRGLLLDGLLADKGVCMGVLYKWVNLARGWQQRCFLLEHGVLSYYRLDGPERFSFAKELQRRPDAKCIGQETGKLLKKDREKPNDVPNSHPLGEVHLKVATLRGSETDDKKFYIFSGTKTLHLRADTKEDRHAWLDVLQTIKDLYTIHLPPLEVLPVADVEFSTRPLRQRLKEARLPEAVIQDSERILSDIVHPLAADLKEERQRNQRLFSRLNQLETEKHQLEEQVVQQLLYSRMELTGNKAELDMTDPNFDNEGERFNSGKLMSHKDDENDSYFFEAADHFEQNSLRRSSDAFFYSATNGESVEEEIDLPMERIGYNYPRIERRQKLPDPKQKERPVSLWSIIKDNVGRDLSKVCLPVYFNEPISTLQKMFEEMEYSSLADRAYEWGRRGNHLMRLLHVAAFAVSGYGPTANRPNKPFNPLLGETYEALWEDKGCRFIAEKVSHHPNVVACHCEGQGWTFWADCNLKNTFWGPSITLNPTGIITLKFNDGETFKWSKVTTGIHNIILGKPTLDHYGVMKIEGTQGKSVTINFKQQGMMDRTPHQVVGFVKDDGTGEKLATVVGKWDEALYYVPGDLSRQHAQQRDLANIPNAVLLWQKNPPAQFPSRYNLTSLAISLNELTPDLQMWLPPTDSRLRPDQRALEDGIFDWANEEKLRLEGKQRKKLDPLKHLSPEEKMTKGKELGMYPRWFEPEGPEGTWRYKGGYWERRDKRDWSGIPDIYALNPA